MVVGLISHNDKTAYREEVEHLAVWCADNNLSLNTRLSLKKRSNMHTLISINGLEVDRVAGFKFLGIHICEELTRVITTLTLIKKRASASLLL